MIHQRQSKAYLGTLQVSCKHLANYMVKNDKYANSNTNHLGKNVSSSDRSCPSCMLCHYTKLQETCGNKAYNWLGLRVVFLK